MFKNSIGKLAKQINLFSFSKIICNTPLNKLFKGQTASFKRKCTMKRVRKFSEITGDYNPVHFDEKYARTTMFKRPIAHGMFSGGLVSAALGMKLPGPGTIYLS